MAENMNYNQAAATYRTATETVQKTRQIVLLYDAVIRFLQQSEKSIQDQKFEERLMLLQKSSNILMGLHSALDFENGGEISQILSNFYSAMDLRIQSVNRTNSVDDLQKIIKEIKIMRDAWHQIDSQSSAVNPVMPAEANLSLPENTGSDFSA